MKLHSSTLQKNTVLETLVKKSNDTFSLGDSENHYLRPIDLFCSVFFNHPMPSDNPLGMFTNIIVDHGLHIAVFFVQIHLYTWTNTQLGQTSIAQRKPRDLIFI